MMKIAVFGAIFPSVLMLSVPQFLVAEDGIAPRGIPLRDGMSMTEVLQNWGPPAERQEFEAKRENTWRYTNSTVRFHDGKVVGWGKSQKLPEPESAAISIPLPPRLAKKIEMKDSTVEEILSELQGYGSSGPSTGGDSPGPQQVFPPQPYAHATPMGMYPIRPGQEMQIE
jgi:hypothetical protein